MKPTNLFFSAATALGLILSAGTLHAAPAPAPIPLTDNQILGLIVTANDAQVNSGDVVKTRGQKQEVKDFAAKLVTEHTAANVEIAALEVKTGLKREESEQSKEFKKNSDIMIDNLKSAKDVDFDRAYIDAQVKMHEDMLKGLDEHMIPAAQNADLKAFLQKARTAVESHLKEAQEIQKMLNPTPTP